MDVLLEEQSAIGIHVYSTDSSCIPPGSRPHYLPHNQCPKCMDVGQDLYRYEGRWILVCSYCKTQYTMELRRGGDSIS